MREFDGKRSNIRLLEPEDGDGPANHYGRRLLQLAASLDQVNPFEKGQLIKWKAGLKNRKLPVYDVPVVVREIFETPIYDTDDRSNNAGSPYFREPLTIMIGILDDDGDFFEYLVDARRFEPF